MHQTLLGGQLSGVARPGPKKSAINAGEVCWVQGVKVSTAV